MLLSLLSILLLFFGVTLGLAWPLTARLAHDPAEKLLATVLLSLLGIWLLAWSVYVFAAPPALLWLLPGVAAFGLLHRRHAFVTTLRDPDARALLTAQILVSAMLVAGLFFIVSYSGGGWASDWFEHWERAEFFLNRGPLDYKFIGRYPLPARPPLANVVTGALLALSRLDFAHYQVFTALFSSLAFLPMGLLARRFGGGAPAIALLAVLVLVNPLFVQNATFPWTKLPAAFFVLSALYFFLRAHDAVPPRAAATLFAASLAGGLLTHYSAGPYAVVLTTVWLVLGWPHRRAQNWRRMTFDAAITGGLLLSTWFVWSLAHYGAKGTFLTNTSVAPSDAYHGGPLLKIALNFCDTLIPHFLRPLDPALIAQSSSWGATRDWFFQCYQLNLPLAFGSIAWCVIARELWRTARAAHRATRTIWIASLTAIVLLSVAVQGERDEWGLTHICLQSLVLLGLAFLAARWSALGRGWRWALMVGGAVDFTFGIALQFAAQNRVLDHPLPGEFTAYNSSALMNLAGKIQHRVAFLADQSIAPAPLMIALAGMIFLLALARARTARSALHNSPSAPPSE